MEATKEITEYRGVEGLVAAEVLADNREEYRTGEVFSIAGVAEISKTTSSSSGVHYYDNAPAITIESAGSDEITCAVSTIALDILARLTGQDYDEKTGTLIEGERKNVFFALGYKTRKTNGDEVYVWRLKGTFAVPDSKHVTINSGTDANGQELKFTNISTTHKFDKTNKGAKAVNVDLGRDLADVTNFFDAVTTPDTLVAKASVPTTPTEPNAPTE